MELKQVQTLFDQLIDQIGEVVVGQQELVEGVLVALFSEGSILIEGPRGLGKTLLVNLLSRSVSCQFRRVQFTPDLMPSDVTGHSVYDMQRQSFQFNEGPVFTNILLADEINRSPPKTQASLLEVMQERQVTVDGKTHQLSPPFLVIATQNPIEHEGTYPLPEAQIDRFMFKLLVDFPPPVSEFEILSHFAAGRDPRTLKGFELQPILRPEQILEIQQAVSRVIIEPNLLKYIVKILGTARTWGTVTIGPSPRAGVSIVLAARTLAACRGRDFVIPDDIKELCPWILRHRLRLRPETELEGISADDTIQAILESVEAPRS
ncbi:MAG: AAA family ATPase [Planctomycetaceae bacterium]